MRYILPAFVLAVIGFRCGGRGKVVAKDSVLATGTVQLSGDCCQSFDSSKVKSLLQVDSSGRITAVKRYFLIGYIANSPDGMHVFDGGIDTIMDHYPNVNELDVWLHKRFHITDIRIIGITEQTKEEHDAFWKGYTGN